MGAGMAGNCEGNYDFHGIGLRISAPGSLEAILHEAERLWAFHQTPVAAPHIHMALHQPPDWRPLEAFGRRRPEIYFDDLAWYYAGGAFVLTQPGVVVVGRADHIDVYLESGLAIAPRRLCHVTLQFAVLEALRHHGLFYLHAACVARPDGRSVVLAGDAGDGKSTMAAALVRAGYDYLSDDAVFIDLRGRAPRLAAYHKHFHMTDDLRARLFPGQSGDWLGEKWAFDPERLFPGRRRRGVAKADLIIFPRITAAARSELTPLSQGETLGALFRSSTQVFFDRALARHHLAALRELAGSAPAYRFSAGRDVYIDPGAYAQYMQEGACDASASN